MAELARMVRVLKGSTTLRAASQSFSLGAIGFTCGPLANRIYQLVGCWGGQGAGCVAFTGWVADWPLAPSGAFAAAGAEGVAAFAAGQGAVAGVAAWVGLCG